MIQSGIKSKSRIHAGNTVRPGAILENPDKLIGVKTTRIYSQIARVGRNPNKQTEKAILVAALERSRVEIVVDGKTVKKDPAFVVMKAHMVGRCFGKQIKILHENALVHIES